MISRRRLGATAAAGVTAGFTIVAASAVRAQTAGQPVRIVVPYIPGGATDVTARLIAEKLTGLLGQQVIVENRAGGNTIVGMDVVAKSKPDGNTLLLGTTTLATNAALGLKQPYDPLKDFTPITTIVDIPVYAAANNDLPGKTWQETAAWINAQPQRVRYAASGLGNLPHLWGELFRAQAKLNVESITYKGSAEAIRDVMGGHVSYIVDVIMPSAVHAKAGKMKGMVIAAHERTPITPDVPTIGEIGYKGLESAVFFGLVGPAGMAAPVVERYNQAIQQILKDAELRRKFVDLGYVITGSTSDAYRQRIAFETDRWTRVVKDNGIKIET